MKSQFWLFVTRMDCSPLGSSVHGILQERILEWIAIPFSRGSSWPRDRTQVSCIAGRFFTSWATREAQEYSQSLLKSMSIKSAMPSNHLIPCLFLPSIFPSITDFSNESAIHITWPKYWSFNFSISPSNEYSWLISFRIDWFDLLAVQGTLKSLLQHYNSKASIHQCSAFFMIQLSPLNMTTGWKNPETSRTVECWGRR